jgi:hypothetical protein
MVWGAAAFAQSTPPATSTAPTAPSGQQTPSATTPAAPQSTAPTPRPDDQTVQPSDRQQVPQSDKDQTLPPSQQKQGDADRPADAGAPPANPDQVTGAPPATQSSSQNGNADLTAKLQKQISDAMPNSNVTVSITNNQLVLTGTVQDESQKTQAEQIASAANPGMQVKNNITVGTSPSTSPATGSSIPK